MPVGEASRASFSTFSKSPGSIRPSKTTRLPFGCKVTLAAAAGNDSHRPIQSEMTAARRMTFDARREANILSLGPCRAQGRVLAPASWRQTQGNEYVFTLVK